MVDVLLYNYYGRKSCTCDCGAINFLDLRVSHKLEINKCMDRKDVVAEPYNTERARLEENFRSMILIAITKMKIEERLVLIKEEDRVDWDSFCYCCQFQRGIHLARIDYSKKVLLAAHYSLFH